MRGRDFEPGEKLWEGSVDERRMKTRSGKRGAQGQLPVDSKAAVQAELERQIARELDEGFEPLGSFQHEHAFEHVDRCIRTSEEACASS